MARPPSLERTAGDRRRAGVSILEVTIAFAILAFGVLGVASAQLAAMRFSNDSRLRSEAQFLAEQKMGEFMQMTGPDLDAAIAAGTADPGNPLDPEPGDGIARAYNRSWAITKDSPSNGVYQISVRVAWSNDRGANRSVTLESVRSEK